jgi:polar amino acid transport system substrate-binding protein
MKLTRRLIGAAIGAALAAAVVLPAVAQEATQALSKESVIETIKQRGTVKIGLSLFKPWSQETCR